MINTSEFIVGIIETAKVLDHETDGAFRLGVTVTDGAGSVTEVLDIEILDMNEPHTIDNLPDVIDIESQTACPTTPGTPVSKCIK